MSITSRLTLLPIARAWFRRLIVVAFAVTGAICVAIFMISRVLSFLWPMAMDARVVRVVYSPDRSHKAVLFNDSGGSVPASYCFDFVYVAPASVADASANRDAYLIYSGSCHSLESPFQATPSERLYGQAPLLRWSSNSVLEISFDPTMAALGIKELTFRGFAAEGKVRITHSQFSEKWR